MQLKVAEIVQRTADIRSFVLKHPQGAPLPGFTAGAHVNVEVRLHDGSAAQRSYSLVNRSVGGAVGHYEIGVLRQAGGRGGSLHMHDAVVPGALIELSEPVNGFPLVDGAPHHTLIAGGIGVTPILCMARVLSERNAIVDLHYFGRSPESLAFRDELRALAGLALHEVHTSDPAVARAALAQAIGSFDPQRHLYVCGPGGMIQSVIDICAQTGWEEHHVHYELFSSQVVGRSNKVFSVHLLRTGQHIEVPADVTLLDALLAHGIDVPHDCRAGVCGSCLTPVGSGAVDHRDSFLTEDDRRQGGLMCVCVSRSADGGEIELDI